MAERRTPARPGPGPPGPFPATGWDGADPGKLQVLEKFFTPQGAAGARFPRPLSSSSRSASGSSASLASWSSAGSLERDNLGACPPRLARSCLDVSMGVAPRRGGGLAAASRLQRGQSQSMDLLGPPRVRLYKPASMEKGLGGRRGPVVRALHKAKSVEALEGRGGAGSQLGGPGSEAGLPRAPPRQRGPEEKQRFSEFLDEITQRVLSPARLGWLGWRAPPPPATSPPTDSSESKASSPRGSVPEDLGAGGGRQRSPRARRPKAVSSSCLPPPRPPLGLPKAGGLAGVKRLDRAARRGGKDLEQAGANVEPPQQAAQAPAGARGQQGLEQTWAELEALKEKFSRLQEDYSSTQRSNRLLEEKLLSIAQTMAAERQALNQHVAELLERLIGAPGPLVPRGALNAPASSLLEAAPDHARPPAPQPGAAPWEGAGGSLGGWGSLEGLLRGQGEEDWGGKGIESTLL